MKNIYTFYYDHDISCFSPIAECRACWEMTEMPYKWNKYYHFKTINSLWEKLFPSLLPTIYSTPWGRGSNLHEVSINKNSEEGEVSLLFPSPNMTVQEACIKQTFILKIYLFIYLFLAALGLRCCTRAFSSCGERGLLFLAVRGILIAVASLVAEHGLWALGLQ